MRLALCTLSAVLLSGCSWLGMGGSNSNSYGQYGAGCVPGAYGGGQYAYGNQYNYMGQGGSAGCSGAGSYGVAGNGYGAGAGAYGAGGGAYGAGSGYGMGAYGAGAGYGMGTGYGMTGAGGYGAGMGGAGAYGGGLDANGLRGMQGATSYAMNGYGAGGGAGYGANTGTLLGSGTQFGSAVGGQYVNGQWVSSGVTTGAAGGTSTYQTVQGAPIYVAQPYPAYYGAASGGGYNYGYGYGYGGGLRGGGAALPFGFEAGVGTDFAIGGDLFPGEAAKPAIPGPGTVSALVPVSYGDAYKEAVSYDLATTYDLDPTTTLIGRIGYSKAEGNLLSVGTVDNGAGLTEELFAEFSDLEQVTLEGGVRKYMGGWNNRMSGVRPYLGATAGFTHNQSVDVTQSSATLVDPTAFQQEYIQSGWTPTASGVIGAEMQVGPRTAIAVESGIRWSDDLNTNFASDDRWSVPLKLRGRVSF